MEGLIIVLLLGATTVLAYLNFTKSSKIKQLESIILERDNVIKKNKLDNEALRKLVSDKEQELEKTRKESQELKNSLSQPKTSDTLTVEGNTTTSNTTKRTKKGGRK